jgi:hypothetical protein
VGLKGFEQRLERLVEGSFGKAFRSGLEPVEIGRRLTRVIDAERSVGVDGTPIAPNNIGVYLSPTDFERFEPFASALARELAEIAREHARNERYHFLGSVTVTLVTDDELQPGECDITAAIDESRRVGSIVLSDGQRVVLGEKPLAIGRMAGNDIVVADARASRQHAEIRPAGNGFLLVDLNSTNGTLLNDSGVDESMLADGDEIRIGDVVMNFEAS